MKYSYSILYVENVLKTIAFYEKAFGFQRKFITPEKDYGELSTGETTLSFASFQLGNSNIREGFLKSSLSTRPFGMELAFTTNNIEIDFEKAKKAGAIDEEGIKEKPWRQKVGCLRDVKGFLISLYSSK